VGTTNVTVRFNEEELRRLDDLAQRMGLTRSDVIRSLVNNFDETLRQEVDRERKRWMTMGFVSALESMIIGPEVIVKFVRRNVDILGYPDFILGMVRVRNRVIVFSHQDRVGSQLLQLVRGRVEEEIRREEAELMRGEGEDEEVNVGRAAQIRIPASRPVRLNTIRVAPAATKYRIMISNRSGTHIPKPTAANMVGRPIISNGGGGTKAAVAASVSKNQKSGSTGVSTSAAPADSQPKDSGPQASASGGSMDPVPAGDFIMALITHSYHKHRNKLLNLVEVLGGDPNAMAH
jgi:hypothetical protein